jgi:tetratricopeptide (TPR) repeat protein
MNRSGTRRALRLHRVGGAGVTASTLRSRSLVVGADVLVVTTWRGDTASALRLALRMTCDEFAAHLGVSVRGVSKWEANPETEVSLKTQQLLDTALKLAADDVQARFAQSRAERATQPPVDDEAPTVELPLLRPQPVGPGMVASLGKGLRHHYTADNLLGPRTLLPVMRAQTEAIESLAQDASGQLLVDLLQVGAGYAEFAGWLAQDSGSPAVATEWYRRALELAEAAGDERMASFVLMRRSVQAIGARRGAQAAQLAQAAQRSRHPSTLRVRAIAAQMEAVGYAVDGAGSDADRAVDRAELIVAESLSVEPVTGDPSIGRYCDLGLYVDITRAKCHLELQRGDTAVEAFAKVLNALPPEYHRDRGQYLGRLAQAYVLAGAPAEACTAAQDALAIAASTGSSRTIRDLRTLIQQLQPWAKTPPVVKLQGMLAGTK